MELCIIQYWISTDSVDHYPARTIVIASRISEGPVIAESVRVVTTEMGSASQIQPGQESPVDTDRISSRGMSQSIEDDVVWRHVDCGEEIDNLTPAELRFRQACQFYVLFKEHHGPSVDPLDTRLFWMCYADAFLMTLVSLKDLVSPDQKKALNGSDLFRMMTVLRNVTVHQAVVSKGSPLNMIVRDIYLGGRPWR